MNTVTLYTVDLPWQETIPEMFTCEAIKKEKSYLLARRTAAFGYKIKLSHEEVDESPDLAWLRYIMYHKKKESDLIEVANKHRELWMKAQTKASKVIGG